MSFLLLLKCYYKFLSVELEKLNNTILFTAFYIAGVSAYFMHNVTSIAIILFLVCITGLYKNVFSCKKAVFYYLMFALAIVNCKFQVKNFDDLSEFIPTKATITGTVSSIPTTNKKDKTKFYLKVQSARLNGVKTKNLKANTIVTINDSTEKLSNIKIADTIEVKGKLHRPVKASNPNQFDYANYLKNHNIYSSITVDSGNWKIVSPPKGIYGKFIQKLNKKRSEILTLQKGHMQSPNIEVLGGIVFGDDAINPPDNIKASFINSGLLHILAASGMNVSIIFGLWFFIGARLKLNYRFLYIFGAILVAVYTLMTGMGPSVLRAAIMIEFVILGKLLDRQADSIALIFFVAFLMLLYDPRMINDVGFQLSFVVTFALIYYCQPVLENVKNKFLEFILSAIFIPFVAQLWAAPIQMFYFNTFSTYSILANLAITPFIMVISFIGFLGALLSLIPIPIIGLKVSLITTLILNPVITILVNISQYFASLPNSLITTAHPNTIQLCLYYSILLLLGYLLRDKDNKKKLITAITILLIILCLTFIKPQNNNCEIITFDVGNADSLLIKTPDNKYILIDTAHGLYPDSKSSFSQANAIITKYLKDNGIKQIEIMLLTHFDADHSGGAVDIIKEIKVNRLVLNKEKDNSKTTKYLLKYIKDAKINTVYAPDNKNIYEEKNFTIKTFTPDFKDKKSENDNSILTLLSYKNFDMLFMGDGSTRSFNRIKSVLNNNDIEIIKSGHHGAKHTVSPKMLKDINADAVIISTGLNNYGHPAKSTLKTISISKKKLYRTDTDNAIKIDTDGTKYSILTYDTQKRRFLQTETTDCKNYVQESKRNF